MPLVTSDNPFLSMCSVSQAYSTSDNVTHIRGTPSELLNKVCPSRTQPMGHENGNENSKTTSNATSAVGNTPNSNNTAVNPPQFALDDAVTNADSLPQNSNSILVYQEGYDSDGTEVQQEMDISTPLPTQTVTTTRDNLFSNSSCPVQQYMGTDQQNRTASNAKTVLRALYTFVCDQGGNIHSAPCRSFATFNWDIPKRAETYVYFQLDELFRGLFAKLI